MRIVGTAVRMIDHRRRKDQAKDYVEIVKGLELYFSQWISTTVDT